MDNDQSVWPLTKATGRAKVHASKKFTSETEVCRKSSLLDSALTQDAATLLRSW